METINAMNTVNETTLTSNDIVNERINNMDANELNNNETLNETITATINENELDALNMDARIESGESVLIESLFSDNENELDENELDAVLETLLETSSNESENDNMESKTWNEPYFMDSTGASKVLKEWADRTSDSFFEEHSDIGNIHPDYTAVRVPVRFHRELRKLGMAREYRSSGTYLWEGVWYFPADREFLELIDSE